MIDAQRARQITSRVAAACRTRQGDHARRPRWPRLWQIKHAPSVRMTGMAVLLVSLACASPCWTSSCARRGNATEGV